MGLFEPPNAIFCTSDGIASGGLDTLHELGLQVPEDVALVGFDNRPLALYQRPPLTTVALPLYEMGAIAGEWLIKEIQTGEHQNGIHTIPCTLIKISGSYRIST